MVKRVLTSIITLTVLMGSVVACSGCQPETKQEIIDSIQATQNQLEELEEEKEAEEPRCLVLLERELSEVEKLTKNLL